MHIEIKLKLKPKIMRRLLPLLLLTVLILLTCSRDADDDIKPTSPPTPVSLKEILISEAEVSVKIGDTHQYKVAHSPANIPSPKYVWETNNDEIATISQTGQLTAVKNGEAIITVSTSDKKFSATSKVIVSEIEAESIKFDSAKVLILIEETKKLAYKITPENTSNKLVSWESSNKDVVTVDSTGVIKGISIGEARITVKTANDHSDVATIIVDPVKPAKIALNKSEITLLLGSKIKLEAAIEPSNATDKTLVWTSSNESIATVNQEGEITSQNVGECQINVTTSNGLTAQCNVKIQPVEVTSITINKPTLNLSIGSEELLTAKILPDNATNQAIIWTSSDENIATVSTTGNVVAKNIGSCTINARTADGKVASCNVIVSPIKVTAINLNKSSSKLNIGAEETLSATVLPSNATDQNLIWSSSDNNIVTVNNTGRVVAVSQGTAIITVKAADGVSAQCTIEVLPIAITSITLNKTSTKILLGSTEILTAQILPVNATNKILTWASSNSSVAIVDQTGRISTNAIGSAIITVSSSDGKSATCSVEVLPVPGSTLKLNKANLRLFIGEEETLIGEVLPANATDQEIIWSSSDTNVAVVSASGRIKTLSVGNTIITAKTAEGLSAQCTLEVVPVEATSITIDKTTVDILLGATTTLNASILPLNTTDKTIIWTSSDENVATVSADGVVNTLQIGQCIINAQTSNGLKASTIINVNPVPAASITLNKSTTEILVGQTDFLSANIEPYNTTYKDVIWTSSDENIATVDSAGVVTGINPGSCRINARTVDGKIDYCDVKINPIQVTEIKLNHENLILDEKSSYSLIATIFPTNASDKELIWTSSDETIATVSNTGIITAITAGTATIYVRSKNGKGALCKVTVKEILATSISLSKGSLTIGEGEQFALQASILPSNVTNKTVIWRTSDSNVATVTNGVVYGRNEGEALVTASTSDGKLQAKCVVSVKMLGIKLSTIPDKGLFVNEEFQISASKIGSNLPFVGGIWNSSNSDIAAVYPSSYGSNAATIMTQRKEGNFTLSISSLDGKHTASKIIKVEDPAKYIDFEINPAKIVSEGGYTYSHVTFTVTSRFPGTMKLRWLYASNFNFQRWYSSAEANINLKQNSTVKITTNAPFRVQGDLNLFKSEFRKISGHVQVQWALDGRGPYMGSLTTTPDKYANPDIEVGN